MKSHGGLFDRIVSSGNLETALRQAARGKTSREDVKSFLNEKEKNLARLSALLKEGEWMPGNFFRFRIRDPKPRLIHCAPFEDRVVHHAIMQVISPCIERKFSDDTYACRIGMGTHRAVCRAQQLIRRSLCFLKLDIRAYFNSINHEILLRELLPVFRESSLRNLIQRLVTHPREFGEKGKGLPIGNLTSQWFANFYLAHLDHYCREHWNLSGYIRYMDDMIFFSRCRETLWSVLQGVETYLAEKRQLAIKESSTRLGPVGAGVPFLGMNIFPGYLRLQRRKILRARRLLRRREHEFQAGTIDERQLVSSASAVHGVYGWFGLKRIIVSELEV